MLLCYSRMRGGRGAARSRRALSMKMWTAPGCMGKSPAALRLLPVATVALLVRPMPSSTLAVRASCAICGAGASPSSSLSSCHTGRWRHSCSANCSAAKPKGPTGHSGRNALARSFRTAARPLVVRREPLRAPWGCAAAHAKAVATRMRSRSHVCLARARHARKRMQCVCERVWVWG